MMIHNHFYYFYNFLNKKLRQGFSETRYYSSSSDNKINNNINFNFSFLDFIAKLLNDDNLDKIKTQAFIESEWINVIKDNFSKNNSLNNNLKKIINKSKEKLELINYSNRIKNSITILNDSINNIEYLLITFALVITYYDKLGYNAIAKIIGNTILYEFYKNIYNKLDNFDYEKFLLDNDIDNRKLTILGNFFLTVFIYSEIIEKDFDHEDSSITYIKINEKLLEDIKNNLIISPASLPMICKPNHWDDNNYGGFLENIKIKNSIYSISSSNKNKMEDKQLLYNAINYLNNHEFSINKDLLNFLNNEGKCLFDNNLNDSEKLQNLISLKIADTYKNTTFYLNTHADWRGRLYIQSFFISYQGSDLSSSLLQLANGEKINTLGKYYLYIYGANLHNQDNISKFTYDERINWVNSNYDKIINLDIDLIQKAENKFLFAAFCLVMKNIHNNPDYIVKFPVFLDATCSGIQHLSALMKDSSLADKVNLKPQTSKDNVEDIYSEILIHVNEEINNYGLNNIDYIELSNVKLTRKIIKLPIMTKVYNVSIIGISEQLKSNLEYVKTDDENKNKNKNKIKNINKKKVFNNQKLYIVPGKYNNLYLNDKYIYKIAEIIFNQIFKLYPSLKSIYSYFIDISKLMIKLEIPLNWITPAGLKLTQKYLKSKTNKVSIRIANKTNTLVLKEFYDEINKRKQSQAIIPNIIHSLDGAHLIKIINNGIDNNFYPILPIHDCFGTHPNKINKLEEMVKLEFISLYINNEFLNKFHSRIIQSIKDNNYKIINENDLSYVIYTNPKIKKDKIEIPNLPNLGNFDITQIIDSKYMIT